MKRGMTIEYLKFLADLTSEVDFSVNGSGVSRISFRGGGSKFFWKSGGICMALGGFGGMLPRENF